MKISVCVAVHNTEQYLERCLDSLIYQTYKEIEIIIVDNGSTDTSRNIIEKYKQSDPRIKSVYQADQGLSISRRRATELATGDYILYVDSDDYVERTLVEIMAREAINDDSDIFHFKAYMGDVIIGDTREGEYNTKDILIEYLQTQKLPMIWLKMYKNYSFLSECFVEKYINNEDIFAFPCILYKYNKIKYVNHVLYYYNIKNTSSESAKERKKFEKTYFKLKEYVPPMTKHVKSVFKEDYHLYSKFYETYLAILMTSAITTPFRLFNIKGKIFEVSKISALNYEQYIYILSSMCRSNKNNFSKKGKWIEKKIGTVGYLFARSLIIFIRSMSRKNIMKL